jgi:probable addiction module antidote protein
MTNVREFDAAYHLDNPEVVAAFIEDAIETGDDAYIKHAIGIVARARGMDEMARRLGMSRSGLYKALGPEGNTSFTTMRRLLASLDVELTVRPLG